MRTCACGSTKYVRASDSKCVSCHRRANPHILKRIAELNRLRAFSVRDKFMAAKNQAKHRGLPWTIGFEEYKDLQSRSCYYCEGDLPRRGIGLDRMDNDKSVGYTVDNVLPCCATCNSIRGAHLSVSETLDAVGAVKARRFEAFREFHESGVHVDQRRLMLSGDVNTESVTKLLKGLDLLESINAHAPITLTIMSGGGDWNAGLAAYERLHASKCPILCIGTGEVASAATIIMQAGLLRLVTPMCLFMVHDGTDGCEGDPRSMESWAEASKKQRAIMYSLYARHSCSAASHWESVCAKDTIFLGQEIVDAGLADGLAVGSENARNVLQRFFE